MLKVFDFEKNPVVDIVNEILVDSIQRGASDIHFDPKENFMQIRVRIDGVLTNYATVPLDYQKNLVTRIKLISGMNITESRLPQDGAIKGKIQDIDLDLRVATINTSRGEKLVVRILDYTLSLSGIENLGFSNTNYKKIMEMLNEPNGIILVTGATGTGKTTTVYSMLQKLNNESTNIMSIEDPIEMDIEGINQVQVNPEIGLTFAQALRSMLRQDPNIIMIGEIRDSETATIAIRASITGHLVLSTLHTNDSLSTIERLMDMEVEKYLLAEALTGIVSQKLARKLCPHCKRLRKTTEYEKDILKKVLNKEIDEIYEAVGCKKCSNGYKGRTAIQEVLLINQEIKDALSMNIRKDKLRKLVYNSNVITLLQDGLIKVINGLTTFEEIIKLIDLDVENNSYNLSEAMIDSSLTINNNELINNVLDSKNKKVEQKKLKSVFDTKENDNDSKEENNDKKKTAKKKSDNNVNSSKAQSKNDKLDNNKREIAISDNDKNEKKTSSTKKDDTIDKKKIIKIESSKNENENGKIKISIIKGLSEKDKKIKNLTNDIIEEPEKENQDSNSEPKKKDTKKKDVDKTKEEIEIKKKKKISKENLELLKNMKSKTNLNINKLIQDTKHTYTKKIL